MKTSNLITVSILLLSGCLIMSCSTTNTSDAQEEPVNDPWSILTAEDNGKPLIIRVRENIPTGVDPIRYPNLIAITWQYESPNESGMPSQQDTERMGLFEDLLDEALESKRLAYLTVVVTGNGVREWQWYSSDTELTTDAINEALAGYERFPVDFISEIDTDWEGYKRFKSGGQ